MICCPPFASINYASLERKEWGEKNGGGQGHPAVHSHPHKKTGSGKKNGRVTKMKEKQYAEKKTLVDWCLVGDWFR